MSWGYAKKKRQLMMGHSPFLNQLLGIIRQYWIPELIKYNPMAALLQTVTKALSGFLFVVSCDGEVFFASRTVEQYLGFHQSDIIHQSALELIHSEDREEFKSQLNWRSQLTQDQQDLSLHQVLLPVTFSCTTHSHVIVPGVRFRQRVASLPSACTHLVPATRTSTRLLYTDGRTGGYLLNNGPEWREWSQNVPPAPRGSYPPVDLQPQVRDYPL
ncbi:hypothetical protein LSH36_11g13000 [Paralvinella palmiformis]|uniref:PAS domain-containing protein n=1 Tax=Paralvinella palmiformis TaxID=53620 RepID=A0AAD9KE03_9ANNE|nr:hypothetical protein LSH36_11g13000 [Paralvinella palmiformis]